MSRIDVAVALRKKVTIYSVAGVTAHVPDPFMQYADLEVVGAGASGGAGGGNLGVGGGAGGYAKRQVTRAQFGASQNVTIGAGGPISVGAGNNGSNSSIGALITATGGTGGPTAFSGGAAPAGVGSSGDLNLTGGYGYAAFSGTATIITSVGGASPMYGSSVVLQSNFAAAALPGNNPGDGGTGGGAASGKGADGLAIITEYCVP